jgi:serine/threonine-protein kinase
VKTAPERPAVARTEVEPALRRSAGPLPAPRSQPEHGTDPERELPRPTMHEPALDPTVRKSLHELGTEPGRPRVSRTDLPTQRLVRGPDDPFSDPTLRRPVSQPPADAGDFGLDPTAVHSPRTSRPAPPVLEPTVRRVVSDVGPAPVGDDFGLDPTSVRPISSGHDPLIGATLGEFRVLERLGSGGMGIVYRGEQPLIGRPVAIKVLRREYAQDPAHARRLLDEARAVAAARHPGIIDVFSFGETPAGEPYLVMELLEGEALDVLLAREGALSPEAALALLVPMANALAAAHAVGVIHRDLKPGNVFVVRLRDGTSFPKLLDFGFARRGEVGARVRQTSVAGTPLYIAPEQARGDAIGPQADLYSFGCLAFEMLSGRPPFTASDLATLLDQHSSLAPPSLRDLAPAVSVELEQLVFRLLAKDPSKRPASALELRTALERLQVAALAPPTRVMPRAPSSTLPSPHPVHVPRRRWAPWLGGAVLVAGLAVALVLRPWAAPQPPVVSPPPAVVTPPADPIAEPPEDPEPEDPPADDPAVDEAPNAPAKPASATPPRPRRTQKQVRVRWLALKNRTRNLPDDLRRIASLQLDEAKDCSQPVDQCWNELSEIERTFFPK